MLFHRTLFNQAVRRKTILFIGSPVVDDIFDVSADVSLLQDVSMPYCPDDEAVQDGLHMELQEVKSESESV